MSLCPWQNNQCQTQIINKIFAGIASSTGNPCTESHFRWRHCCESCHPHAKSVSFGLFYLSFYCDALIFSLPVDADEYDRIYQQERRLPRINKKLINFNGNSICISAFYSKIHFIGHVPFFLTQGSYNADSEDEEWLKTRRTITVDDFEHIIEKLETASPTADIIKPRFVFFVEKKIEKNI